MKTRRKNKREIAHQQNSNQKEKDLSKSLIADLRLLCEENGLDKSGKKSDLIKRIKDFKDKQTMEPETTMFVHQQEFTCVFCLKKFESASHGGNVVLEYLKPVLKESNGKSSQILIEIPSLPENLKDTTTYCNKCKDKNDILAISVESDNLLENVNTPAKEHAIKKLVQYESTPLGSNESNIRNFAQFQSLVAYAESPVAPFDSTPRIRKNVLADSNAVNSIRKGYNPAVAELINEAIRNTPVKNCSTKRLYNEANILPSKRFLNPKMQSKSIIKETFPN